MKLLYHNDFNFGDALNPILFGKLTPDLFDDDDSEAVLGIGTIIGQIGLPANCRRGVIFSSGYGYGPKPKLDPRWRISCVRGPMTCRALGMPERYAVSDGAILAGTLVDRDLPKRYAVAYMPHHYSEDKFNGWADACREAGIHPISPNVTSNRPVEFILREIQQTERLITEALHGAIIADALRVPWIPVRSYRHINSFKWIDYAASMEIKLRMNRLPSVFDRDFLDRKLRSKIPDAVPGPAADLIVRGAAPWLGSHADAFRSGLEKLAAKGEAYLCRETVLEDRKTKLLEKLGDLAA